MVTLAEFRQQTAHLAGDVRLEVIVADADYGGWIQVRPMHPVNAEPYLQIIKYNKGRLNEEI